MRATQILPSTYQRQGTLNLSRQPLLIVALSLGSVLLFGLTAGTMLWALPLLHPGIQGFSGTVDGITGLLRVLLFGLALLVVLVVLHEGIHGLVFWRVTGDRPQFGFKGLYAYTAAPSWYLGRNQYIMVALAPLLLITVGGILLIVVLPTAAVLPTMLVVALNAGGAIGDIVVTLWLLRADATVLVQDTGDAVTVFRLTDPSLGGVAH